MVGLGLLMILLAACGSWLRRGQRLWNSRALQRFAVWMGPSGIVAILAGWFTTEIGRQPWTVYGLLRTADSVSAHSATQLSVTLVVFVLVYFVVFGAGVAYLLRLIRVGPGGHDASRALAGGPGHDRQPMRPLSAASGAADYPDDINTTERS